MGEARNPTLGTTLCAVRALMPTLVVTRPPHVCHRQGTGLSSLARTMQQDMNMSEAPPRYSAPLHSHGTVHVSNLGPKIGDKFSLRHGGSRWVFSAPQGARESETEAGEDDHATESSSKQETGNGNNYGNQC